MVDGVENGWEGRWLMGLRMVGRGGGCWGLGWLGGEVVDGVEGGSCSSKFKKYTE